VHIASPANFDALIADGDVPALVMFFAPWCGHCKQAKEPFGSAAASTKSAKYIAIDCTKHQGNLFSVHTLVDEIKSFQNFATQKISKVIRHSKSIKMANLSKTIQTIGQ